MTNRSIERLPSSILTAISAIALACASGMAIQKRTWIEVSTPNFQIMSTMSRAEATTLAIELERFRVVIARFTNAAMSDSPIPTKIFAFKRAGDFQHFTRSWGVAGWG